MSLCFRLSGCNVSDDTIKVSRRGFESLSLLFPDRPAKVEQSMAFFFVSNSSLLGRSRFMATLQCTGVPKCFVGSSFVPFLDGVSDRLGNACTVSDGQRLALFFHTGPKPDPRFYHTCQVDGETKCQPSVLIKYLNVYFIFGRDFELTYAVQIKLENAVQVERTVAIYQHFLKNLVANVASLRSEILFSGYQVSFSSRACILWDTFRR